MRLCELLYKQYSRLEFSHDYDRPLGIAGLEQRLLHAFGTQGGYGVLQAFFHRSLLWHRDQIDPMIKIEFPTKQKFRVPSWSWMSRNGHIAFLAAPPRSVEWNYTLCSPWYNDQDGSSRTERALDIMNTSASSSSASIWYTSDPAGRIDLRGVARELHKLPREFDIYYDEVDAPRDRQVWCVCIGRKRGDNDGGEVRENQSYHYVLLVVQKLRIQNNEYFERVGVGVIHGSLIEWERPSLEVRII